jgi:hypothetical protein
MAYTIVHPDGETLLILADSKVDEKTTSISLIGKNVPTYGEYYNNNLIALLQNFASVDEPRSPLVGQLWYDTASGRVKVYDLNQKFKPVTGTLIAESKPVELSEGDFWYDTINEQIYFSIDGANTRLIGPSYPSEFGRMGITTATLLDNLATPFKVGLLYNNDSLVGIISDDSFTLQNSFNGLSEIIAGITLNPTIAGVRFVGTATSADAIQGIDITKLIRNDINEATTGSFSIINDLGLAVGTNQNITMYVDSATNRGVIQHNASNVDFRIRITNSTVGLKTAVNFDSANSYIGLWTENPQYPLDVLGNTRIQGNLIVLGTVTNVVSTNLQINDKNIELGFDVNADSGVNDGGITLRGTTDHTILWKNDSTGWNFNDKINITTSTDYLLIGGLPVLNQTSLGAVVSSAPGLEVLGTLQYLKVDNVYVNGNTISSTGTDETLYLDAAGTGTVDVSYNRITNVAAPIEGPDSANKQYVDDQIQQKNNSTTVLSMDVTNFSAPVENTIISYLDLLMPITNGPGDEVYNLSTGTRIRVLCSEVSINKPISLLNLNIATTTVDKGGVQNAQSVITAIAGTSTQQTLIPTVTYTIRQFRVDSSLAWTYDGIIT